VTIFGESAGGFNVLANVASPTAKGLFHRGIVESGAYAIAFAQGTLPQAEAIGMTFADAVGCSSQTADCLRSLSAEDIIAKAPQYTGNATISVDGTILTQTIEAALRTGEFNRVPVINGSNHDEMRWFVAQTELATGHVTAASDYSNVVTATFGPVLGPLVLGEYPLSAYDSPSEALAAAEGSFYFNCSAERANRLLAPYVPTFAYEFADETAPSSSPPVSFPYGAAHTYEIQYLFLHYHGAAGIVNTLSSAQERLSDQMVRYWTTFARTGNPNGDEGPHWPQYDSAFDKYLSLQVPAPVLTSNYSADHHCSFWDSF
jgi:para-nitrobenzyl esterase